VWKYDLQLYIRTPLYIDMPEGAEILDVQTKCVDDNPYMWVLCDPGMPDKGRIFYIFPTGERLPEDMALKYIGTFQQVERKTFFNYIWHLFEKIQSKVPPVEIDEELKQEVTMPGGCNVKA
jgi:hypothetical protein